ncbi:hypothetical protein GGX14DRAFT_634628 [Mycena pura]|uniref:Actin-like ATPase domain-containing protein n=1 Tax=Mycena pura TaxID=153505 RepID=A0AAD6YA53_9AGAR|nr:hypothetical protein GGX14DRAFT_634628 [Mycena pura]
MAENRRPPYRGSTRKLIVSIDVGTTYTATSFCLLQPGNVPKFEEILRWPKQATPDAKVPSVLYYDKQGKAMAFGAETEDEDIIMEGEEHGWVKVEWWKLRLRPQHLPIIRNLDLPSIPNNVTVDKIFADYLRYIKEQVKAYISSTYGSGGDIWDTLSPTMYVILTTPNGWEGTQQNRMRQAAIAAGLVDSDGGRRVRFVTEAEAAVLYAADSGNVEDWLVKDSHLILCDCGGGTVDITGYQIISVKPALKLEESAASRCAPQKPSSGASERDGHFYASAHFYLERLHGTEWDDEERMEKIVYHFDRNAKKKFAEADTVCYVQLDSHKTIPELGITRGRLKITGWAIIVLREIKQGLDIAFENGGRLADKVILVGGLASSPYVYSKLVDWGNEIGVSVTRPDGPTVKAVANGALAWHLDSSVGSRIAKYHYGISCRIPYDHHNPEHQERASKKFLGLDGLWYLDEAWAGVVNKNDKLKASQEFRRNFSLQMGADTTNFEYRQKVYAYRRLTPPTFLHFPGNGKKTLIPGFDVICYVQGDLRKCFQAAPFTVAPSGVPLKKIKFVVCLALGETEITARLRWVEDDEEVYGPATIAYD